MRSMVDVAKWEHIKIAFPNEIKSRINERELKISEEKKCKRLIRSILINEDSYESVEQYISEIHRKEKKEREEAERRELTRQELERKIQAHLERVNALKKRIELWNRKKMAFYAKLKFTFEKIFSFIKVLFWFAVKYLFVLFDVTAVVIYNHRCVLSNLLLYVVLFFLIYFWQIRDIIFESESDWNDRYVSYSLKD
jgi:ABC-type multidrug transport system fused ATPase/permease subunit